MGSFRRKLLFLGRGIVISFRLLRLREWFNGVVRGYCPLFILFIKGKGRIRNRAGVRDEIYQVTVGNYKKSLIE